MKIALREAVHMCELRTMPPRPFRVPLHLPRNVAQVQEVHPALADAGKFIDWEKLPFRPTAVGDEGGVQEVGIRKERKRLNGEGILVHSA